MWQSIERQLNKKLPFVVYRKPKHAQVQAIFQNNNTLNRISDFTESGFVFAPFQSHNPPYFIKVDRTVDFDFSEPLMNADLENKRDT